MNYDHTSCGIAKTLEIIGGKWTPLIIRDLLEGPRRFGELETSLAGISPRTLATRLRELEQDDVLVRQCEEHGRPVYVLTDKGRSLSVILDQMRAWGQAHPASSAPVVRNPA